MRRSEFRVIYYDHDAQARVLWPNKRAEDTDDAMTSLLEHYVESGYATGGHVEVYAGNEIGWVVSGDQYLGSDQSCTLDCECDYNCSCYPEDDHGN